MHHSNANLDKNFDFHFGMKQINCTRRNTIYSFNFSLKRKCEFSARLRHNDRNVQDKKNNS